ncbi:uncharacterized protein A4U43_UnF8340 [Asparagus officinalis]|uniref:Retrotransposon gag domain-containing protein n=1 Tax=Asparagus officinalis TaxID=4686 RepID=A0A1R3L5Y6_ASPOF|nr:uncharacterized protein A4U43_UnF8340 [Asparagus officinalis]
MKRWRRINVLRIFEIRRDIFRTDQADDSIAVYFTRIKSLWDELSSSLQSFLANIDTLQNIDRLTEFLHGLNETLYYSWTNSTHGTSSNRQQSLISPTSGGKDSARSLWIQVRESERGIGGFEESVGSGSASELEEEFGVGVGFGAGDSRAGVTSERGIGGFEESVGSGSAPELEEEFGVGVGFGAGDSRAGVTSERGIGGFEESVGSGSAPELEEEFGVGVGFGAGDSRAGVTSERGIGGFEESVGSGSDLGRGIHERELGFHDPERGRRV